MQTSYSRNMDTAVKGQVAAIGDVARIARTYALASQVGTLTVGGTAANGDYVATFTDPDTGEDIAVTVTRSGGTPSSNNDLAAALAAAVNDAANGVAHLITATVATNVVTYTAVRKGEVIDVATSAPGTGTLAAAVTTAATAADLPVGIGVVQASDDDECRLATSGDAAVDILGVVERDHSAIKSNAGSSGDDSLEQGATVSIVKRGEIWVEVEEAVTPGDDVYCRVVAGAGEQAGAFRTDADSGDAVQLSSATWRSTTTGAGLAKLALSLP